MSAERCQTCSRRLVEITITADGRPLTMRSCSNCDTREWTRASDPVGLDGVLDELASPR
jgi:hypothetical protein